MGLQQPLIFIKKYFPLLILKMELCPFIGWKNILISFFGTWCAPCKKEIPELSYWSFKPEVKYSDNSRIDFLLTSPSQQTYLEIKSVTLMREKGLAEFPDTITKRGSKHLEDLSKMVTSGHKAVLLFLCMRKDVNRVRIAADLDIIYNANIKAALKSGVQLICYDTQVTRFGVRLGKPIVVEI